MNNINTLQHFITFSSGLFALIATTVSPAFAEASENAPERFVLQATEQTSDGSQTLNARLSMVRNRPCDDSTAKTVDPAAADFHDEFVYAEVLAIEIGEDKVILPFPSFTALFDAHMIRIEGDADDFTVTVTGSNRSWSREFRFVDGWPAGDSGELPAEGIEDGLRVAQRAPEGATKAHAP